MLKEATNASEMNKSLLPFTQLKTNFHISSGVCNLQFTP